jgi:hypothetical protein
MTMKVRSLPRLRRELGDVRIAGREAHSLLSKPLAGTLITTEVQRDSEPAKQTKITCTVDFAHTASAKQFLDRKSADGCSAQIASGSDSGVGLHAGLGHWKRST